MVPPLISGLSVIENKEKIVVDFSIGCMIYLMAVGQFPFIDMNEYLIFQKIKAASVKYPEVIFGDMEDVY